MKILFLDARDIAHDEPFTIFYSQADFNTLFSMFATSNNSPFFYILLHFWIQLFGISSFAVRFLPFATSAVTVIFIYFTGKKFFNSKVAIVSALIFSFSNFHIGFSHEAREYSLFALLTTMSMYLFLSLLSSPQKKKYLVLLTVANILLIYTHFFGLFVLFVQFSSCLLFKETRKSILKKYLLSLCISGLFYLPYLRLFITRLLESSAGTWVPEPGIVDLYNNLWKFSNTPVTTVIFSAIILSAGIKYLVVRKTTSSTVSIYTKIILMWFLVPYLIMFFASFAMPMFLDRYLIFISPAWYLLTGLSVSYLFKSKLFYVLSAIAVFSIMVTCKPNVDNKRRTKELVAKVKELKKPKTVVYICPDWFDLNFAYYYNIDYFRQYRHTREKLNDENIFPVSGLNQIDTASIKNFSNVIYLDSWAAVTDKDSLIYKYFCRRFKTKQEFKIYDGFKIYNFR